MTKSDIVRRKRYILNAFEYMREASDACNDWMRKHQAELLYRRCPTYDELSDMTFIITQKDGAVKRMNGLEWEGEALHIRTAANVELQDAHVHMDFFTDDIDAEDA